MYAADFKQKARTALQGKWALAVLTALAAAILGAEVFPFDLRVRVNIEPNQPLILYSQLTPIEHGIIALFITLSIVGFFLSGVTEVGYCRFQLNLLDGKTAQPDDLFSQFRRFGTCFCLYLMRLLYIFLWSLLFFIPGIIAAYRYAMAPYILAENPSYTASEAINCSKKMMHGYKARLFCLEFSFLGWKILSAFTFGIANLWINPYVSVSRAAFYRWLSRETSEITPPAQPAP